MSAIIGGTTGFGPPSWTTAGRPSSPVNGQLGWNSTLLALEVWNGIAWVTVANQAYTVNYLVVAGGGGGAQGGGGAVVVRVDC